MIDNNVSVKRPVNMKYRSAVRNRLFRIVVCLKTACRVNPVMTLGLRKQFLLRPASNSQLYRYSTDEFEVMKYKRFLTVLCCYMFMAEVFLFITCSIQWLMLMSAFMLTCININHWTLHVMNKKTSAFQDYCTVNCKIIYRCIIIRHYICRLWSCLEMRMCYSGVTRVRKCNFRVTREWPVKQFLNRP